MSRTGDWIGTYSGKKYFPTDPDPADVDIKDIGRSLSKMCRFGGHSKWFYSVAEHSIHVSRVVPPQFALQGLLHDATEAYCVDVPRPLKVQLTNYADIEERNWQAIASRFGLPPVLDQSVKDADNAVLMAERDQIMSRKMPDWHPNLMMIQPAKVRISCMTPSRAFRLFMWRFEELTQP